MSERKSADARSRIRSGRRFAVDIDAPRDKTVCFTVSDDEKEAIDALAASVNRTRSSILSRIVNAFVNDAAEKEGSVHLQQLLEEFRSGELPRERRIRIERK